MSLPIPIPSYELISTLKMGDTVEAYCELLATTIRGVVTRPLGVNEWEMKANGKMYGVNPTNIVGVIRAPENIHHVSDKPPKEPKDKKQRESEDLDAEAEMLVEMIVAFLSESDEEARPAPIRGEYWYCDGDLVFADGDVGDWNHESYAQAYATRIVLDAVGLDSDDATDFQSLIPILDDFLDDKDPEWRDKFRGEDTEEAIKSYLGKNVPDQAVMDVAFDRQGVDSRSIAAKKWGWIRIKGIDVDVWTADPGSLEKAYDAVTEAIQTKGGFEGEVDDASYYIRLWVLSTGKSYRVPLDVLSQGAISSQQDDAINQAATRAANRQIAQMDKATVHPAYKGKLGD